jgi:hypothetical protein
MVKRELGRYVLTRNEERLASVKSVRAVLLTVEFFQRRKP